MLAFRTVTYCTENEETPKKHLCSAPRGANRLTGQSAEPCTSARPRGRRGAPALAGQRAREPQVRTSMLSSWLQLLRSWSLRKKPGRFRTVETSESYAGYGYEVALSSDKKLGPVRNANQ